MTQTATQAPRVVPYDVFQRERARRIEAEKERDYYKQEFFLARKIRRAPVLRPIDKDVLEEFRHVQKWGTVHDEQENTRANFTTIASNLNSSSDTVARSAERLEKLGIADIREHQGPKDERERKYIQVKEDSLKSIDTLEDPAGIVPKQGGNRYICTKCDSPDVALKTVKTLRCNICHHEEVVEDKGWIEQIGHKAQKQLAFENKRVIDEETGEVIEVRQSKHGEQGEEQAKASCFSDREAQPVEEEEAQKQLAGHSVYTQSIDASASVDFSQKQVAFREPPEFLRKRRIWCCGRKEWNEERQKFDKVPFIADMRGTVKAKSNNPSTWRTYEQARAILEKSQEWTDPQSPPFDFLMFMCDGTFTFLDQDHCIKKETGEIDPAALERAQRLNSFTEKSWSEEGLHTYTEGKLPPGRRRIANIEMYDQGRPCVYTGKPLDGFPLTVERRQEEITALHREIFPPQPEMLWNVEGEEEEETSEEELQALLTSIFEKVSSARNGQKVLDLFKGEWSTYYQSRSEADLGLCRMLVYYGDIQSVSTLDWLFRQSGLYREKWERDDYRTKTINLAISQHWQEAS